MGGALLLVLIGVGGLAVGLLVGRYYVPDDRQLRRAARHGRAYLRALSESLARDPEAALAELRGVVEENVEDPEPYFAMASLFRSRGEYERAIRVHQALALRERDRKKLRLRALYELGLDFRAAGMPRRATRAMEEVLEDEPAHEGGLRAAAGLYEEQGRWGDAASMWRRLAKHRGEPPSSREHHLRVAAGQAAIGRDDLDSARQWLKEARALPEGESPHFLVAAAELATARGNPAGARDRLRQALRAEPALVPYLWPALLAAERELAAERGLSDVAGGGAGTAGDERRDGRGGRDELDDEAGEGGGAAAAPRLAAAAVPALAAPAAAPQLEAAAPLALPEATSVSSADAASSGAAGSAPSASTAIAASSDSPPSTATSTATSAATPPALASFTAPARSSSPRSSAVSLSPAPASQAPEDDTPAAAAARARVDALLRELAAESGLRLELVLARAALAQAAPGQVSPAMLASIVGAFPDSVAAKLAVARLELGRGEAPGIAASLAQLTSGTGPLAWALDGRWRCAACGKASAQFAWRCAGCRRWSTLALETGAPEPPPPSPRDRRGERRRSDGSAARSDGGRADRAGADPTLPRAALPMPALDSGLSEDDLAARDRKRSLLGRAGGWLAGVWSSTRGPSAR